MEDKIIIPVGLLRDLIWAIRPYYPAFGGIAGENQYRHAFHTKQAAENVLARFENRFPETYDYQD